MKGSEMELAVQTKLLAFGLCLVLFSAVSEAKDKCLADINDQIQVFQPKAVFDSLINPITDKGEFETTKEFELRTRDRISELTHPIWVKASFDPAYAKYDADSSNFIIQVYAWDNLGVGIGDVFQRGNQYGIDPGIGPRKVGLSHERNPTGHLYTAKNAMGSEVTVIEVEQNHFGVFDRPGEWTENTKSKWITNRTTKSDYGSDIPTISVEIDRQRAKNFRSTTMAAILIRPKPPFKAHSVRRMTPTFTNPIEGDWHTYIIVAYILCAALTNQDHQVITLIEATEPRM